MSNVLVYAEHHHQKLPKSTLVAIRAGLDLAAKTGGACYAAVFGTGIDSLASEVAEYGVKKVFAVEHPSLEHYVADAYTQAVCQLAQDKGCDTILATATAVGKDLLPRVAV